MADEVILLSWWASPFGLRASIALAEKGVEYEYKEEDLLSDKSPLLLRSNPIHKKVPVLIHNGRPICESLAIVEYIDQVWNTSPSLMPRDPYDRASARFWADFINKKVYESGSMLWRSKGDEQAAAKEEFLGYLKLLEGELGDKPYFSADTFGYLDIALAPFSCRFHTFETFGGFSIEEECPKLISWVKRCMERESVSKALPDPKKVYEFVCAYRKRLGIE